MENQKKAEQLVHAVESNTRIKAVRQEIANLKAEIQRLDQDATLILMQSTTKQMRVDGLERELQNAVEVNIQDLIKSLC